MKARSFLVFILLMVVSCTEYTRKDWDRLENRKFILREVTYIHLDKTKTTAYEFNRDYPLKEILFLLAGEFGINIDITEYQNFRALKILDQLEVAPGLRKEKFIWKNPSSIETGNEIFVTVSEDYFGEKDSSINLLFKHKGHLIKTISVDYASNSILFKNLKFYINDLESRRKLFFDNNYAIKSAPGLTEGKVSTEVVLKNKLEEKNRIKLAIKKYLETIPADRMLSSKKELIDFINNN